ncbi:MAG TPA: hypothetical protein VFA65_00790 [Bryobacteraceae bacterium]|nr:hypothetical protein [Bryobacteraceae bacterium]
MSLNSCSSCVATKTVTLAQTVGLANYASVIQNNGPHLTYGGDVFVMGCITASGAGQNNQFYQAHIDHEATFQVDFLNSSGGIIITDISPALLNGIFGCPLGPGLNRHRYNYRRNANIPTGTASVRFTATIKNGLNVCTSYQTTTAQFKNGLDNIFMELSYGVRSSGSGQSGRQKKP